MSPAPAPAADGVRRILPLFLAAVLAAACLAILGGDGRAGAQGTLQWYKADLHHHTVLSADAFTDLGIVSTAAKTQKYSALFLTDHNQGSDFPISQMTANHMVMDEKVNDPTAAPPGARRWTADVNGTPSATTLEFVSSQANTGTQSLSMSSTSTGFGETSLWTRRGPNLRSGDIIVKVAIRPTRIDPGTGVYVSLSFGGDPSVDTKYGYTTAADGLPKPGKSTVLVWQLGNPRAPSTDPNERVLTYDLGSYNLDEWKTYEINISDALDDIPASDRPIDTNGVAHLKIATGGTGGTASAFVDSYAIDAMAPVAPAQEFIDRNSLIPQFETPTFRMFPAIEPGIRDHTGRLNFAITDPAQYTSYDHGIDAIPQTQASGYPAILNHPNADGGQKLPEVVDSNASGADLMEVHKPAYADVWDDILNKGVQLLGSAGSDTHEIVTANSFSTFIRAGDLDLDAFARSLFEGRTYMSQGAFKGPVLFNRDGSDEPLPARYPIHVSDTLNEASVRLRIPNGVATGYTVRWIRNDQVIATDPTSGTSYDTTRSIDLTGASTYVRAEVRNAGGTLLALTQPIRFTDVAGLPSSREFEITGVDTADGRKYTVLDLKGIRTPSWDDAQNRLSFTLTDPVDAVARLLVKTTVAPTTLTVGGTEIPESTDAAAFDAAAGSAWYHDTGTGQLRLKVHHTTADEAVVLTFPGSGDADPPTVPGNFTASPDGARHAHLTWDASSDASGVAGYTVKRGDTVIATLPGSQTSFDDENLTPETDYSYTVEAFDPFSNRSGPSPASSIHTLAIRTTVLNAVADTWINEQFPDHNMGTHPNLRTDASPVYRSLLRFDVNGINGRLESAKLSLVAGQNSTIGFQVHAVSDNSWDEHNVDWLTAPAFGATVGAASSTTLNARSDVDVTSYVTANGLKSFGLTTTSTGGVTLSSREDVANPPHLVIETSGGDTVNPSVPTDVAATATTPRRVALSWTASTDDTSIDHYTIRRDGQWLRAVDAPATSVVDTTATPGTTHSYTVEAVDPANNGSGESSPPATATTPAANATAFDAVADTYDSSLTPNTNYGTATSLRTDAAGDVQRGYLKFDLSSLNGTVDHATLRLRSETTSGMGYEVRALSDTSWTEGGLKYSNAPATPPDVVNVSGPTTAGTWTDIDVTSMIDGPGLEAMALTTVSTSAVRVTSRDGVNKPQLIVETTAAPDAGPPTTPQDVTADAVGGSEVHVGWTASTDDNAVTGYRVRRDGTVVGTVGGTVTDFTDDTVSPGVAYSYTVQAFDAAGHDSAESDPPAEVTTPTSATTTLTAVADAYTDSGSPGTNYGSNVKLRADGGPAPTMVRSFLRFDASGLTGTVDHAVLRVFANTSSNTGHQIRGLGAAPWSENLITHLNAPAPATAVAGSSGTVVAGNWTEVDVTSLVTGPGSVDLELTTTSSTAISYASRETGAATAPQLVVETSGSGGTGGGDTEAPTAPTGVNATAEGGRRVNVTWTASTDNTAVTGYTVRRDGAVVGNVDGVTTSFADETVSPSTAYTYTVQAADAADNTSPESDPPASVTTPGVTTSHHTATADVYTDATSATTSAANFGTATKLRTDSSPLQQSFLKFDLSGVTGSISSATLRVFANSANNAGYDVKALTDTSWTEGGVTHNNQPAIAPAVLGSSGAIAAGTWTSVDVSSVVNTPGVVGLALIPRSSTALSLQSREAGAATAPELVIESG